MSGSVLRAIAAALVALVLAGCGAATTCADPPAYTAARTQACADPTLAVDLPAGAAVEVLVEAGDTLPAALRPDYRRMFTLLLDCLPEGTNLVVAPVDDRSASEPPVFWQPWSWAGNGNPLVARGERHDLEQRAVGAFDRLQALDPHGDQTEVWAALRAAGKRLALVAPSTPRVIACLCTGWEQSALINMADADRPLDAARAAAFAATAARLDGTPDLQGVSLMMAGVTDGEGGWADQRLTTRLQSFWTAALGPTGVRVVWVGPLLPGEGLGCTAAGALPRGQASDVVRKRVLP